MKYSVYVSKIIDYVFEVDAPDEQTARDNFSDGKLVDESDGGYDVPWQVTQIDTIHDLIDKSWATNKGETL